MSPSEIRHKWKPTDYSNQRGGRGLLFHYTTRFGALAITACSCINTTIFKGPTANGIPRPRGAYAASIPLWSDSITRSEFSQIHFNSTTARVGRLGWFVAVDSRDFFPVTQTPFEFVKPTRHPLQPTVSVTVITIGPNLMLP